MHASKLNEFNTGRSNHPAAAAISSRFREERVAVSCRLDFINGTCGGHAFAIGLGTKERRCEELTIGMSFSGASLRLRDWTFTLNGPYVVGSPTDPRPTHP